MNLSNAIFSGNLKELEDILKANPSLASEEIPLPDNPAKAHPLHRICDGVFNKHYTEDLAVQMAKVLMECGSGVNGNALVKGTDSPLTAACSLHCDKLALLYIERGAQTDHQGCLGGTALHWASWCGRDVVVEKLVAITSDINRLCIDFKSTPLFWAIHGFKFGGKDNQHHQLNCARMLLKHGADPSIPNFEGYLPVQLLGKDDKEFLELFKLII